MITAKIASTLAKDGGECLRDYETNIVLTAGVGVKSYGFKG